MNIRQIEIDLDNAWWGHGDIKYEDKLSSVKLMGFRVYRNSEGKHKVVATNNDNDFVASLSNLFGFKE